MKKLKKFAVVDSFSSFTILDVNNEIKIALLKWERFADKEDRNAVQLKAIFDEMFEIMEDLYFYEIFGFFSTSVWPDDIEGLKLPCRIFCGCADGWQKEPVLTADGEVKFENVIRFENSLPDADEKELLCMTISSRPEILEGREKCIYSDEQIEVLKKFVRENRDIIVLHNAGIIDSAGFSDALKIRNEPEKHPVKYKVRLFLWDGTVENSFPIPTTYFVAMDDMDYAEAKDFYKKLKRELDWNYNFCIYDFDVLQPGKTKSVCCFCGEKFDGRGNSTWPIYFRQDGEKYRCCDKCNKEYVIPARVYGSRVMESGLRLRKNVERY